jgi:hypothetical protein
MLRMFVDGLSRDIKRLRRQGGNVFWVLFDIVENKLANFPTSFSHTSHTVSTATNLLSTL